MSYIYHIGLSPIHFLPQIPPLPTNPPTTTIGQAYIRSATQHHQPQALRQTPTPTQLHCARPSSTTAQPKPSHHHQLATTKTTALPPQDMPETHRTTRSSPQATRAITVGQYPRKALFKPMVVDGDAEKGLIEA